MTSRYEWASWRRWGILLASLLPLILSITTYTPVSAQSSTSGCAANAQNLVGQSFYAFTGQSFYAFTGQNGDEQAEIAGAIIEPDWIVDHYRSTGVGSERTAVLIIDDFDGIQYAGSKGLETAPIVPNWFTDVAPAVDIPALDADIGHGWWVRQIYLDMFAAIERNQGDDAATPPGALGGSVTSYNGYSIVNNGLPIDLILLDVSHPTINYDTNNIAEAIDNAVGDIYNVPEVGTISYDRWVLNMSFVLLPCDDGRGWNFYDFQRWWQNEWDDYSNKTGIDPDTGYVPGSPDNNAAQYLVDQGIVSDIDAGALYLANMMGDTSYDATAFAGLRSGLEQIFSDYPEKRFIQVGSAGNFGEVLSDAGREPAPFAPARWTSVLASSAYQDDTVPELYDWPYSQDGDMRSPGAWYFYNQNRGGVNDNFYRAGTSFSTPFAGMSMALQLTHPDLTMCSMPPPGAGIDPLPGNPSDEEIEVFLPLRAEAGGNGRNANRTLSNALQCPTTDETRERSRDRGDLSVDLDYTIDQETPLADPGGTGQIQISIENGAEIPATGVVLHVDIPADTSNWRASVGYPSRGSTGFDERRIDINWDGAPENQANGLYWYIGGVPESANPTDSKVLIFLEFDISPGAADFSQINIPVYVGDAREFADRGMTTNTLGFDLGDAGAPSAPTLIAPSGTLIDTPRPGFQWSSVPDTSSYLLEVSGPTSFTRTITSCPSDCFFIPDFDLEFGDYIWRVTPFDSGVEGTSSSPSAFELTTLGSITGIITDNEGNPIENGAVFVGSGALSFADFACTNSTGAYSFSQLPMGDDYVVSNLPFVGTATCDLLNENYLNEYYDDSRTLQFAERIVLTPTSPDASGINMQMNPSDCSVISFPTTVNNATDLATAIDCANANATADTINLGTDIVLATPYKAENGLPTITSEITLDGQGFTLSRDVNATDSFRLLENESLGELTLRDITLSNGFAKEGGAISNRGVLLMLNADVNGNRADRRGGGLFVNGGTTTIVNSLIANNAADVLHGGGMMVVGDSDVRVFNTTIANNAAQQVGGGLVTSGAVTITNTTIAGNTADKSGGIHVLTASTTLNNTLVAGNTAPNNAECGGGLGGYVTANNSLFGSNSDAGGCGAIGTQTNTLVPAQDLKDILDTGGGPTPLLTNNGGPTATVALPAISPAINGGDATYLISEGTIKLDVDGDALLDNPVDVDQRGAGFARTDGAQPDIGAFELNNACAPYDFSNPVTVSTVPTLIEAINCANANMTSDTIVLGQSLTVTIADNDENALPVITSAITIDGAGHTLDRSSVDRMRFFEVADTGGLTLTNITLFNGFALNGGAVYNGGALTVDESTLTGNQAQRSGGAIYAAIGTRTAILHSTLANNQAVVVSGGALFVDDSASTRTSIVNSTIANNDANFRGGAIHIENAGGTHLISNATITGNEANLGGALSMPASVLTVENAYIGGNVGRNGGQSCRGDFSTSTALSTLFGTDSSDEDCIFNQFGFGVNTNSAIVTVPLGSVLQVDVNDQPIVINNGGATPTVALVSGSPAIDFGDNALIEADVSDRDGDSNTSEALPFDQRGTGFGRVVNTTVDAGAYEADLAIATASGGQGYFSRPSGTPQFSSGFASGIAPLTTDVTWNAIEYATEYTLYVAHIDGTETRYTLSAEDASCDGTACTYTIVMSEGQNALSVQAENAFDSTAWSDTLNVYATVATTTPQTVSASTNVADGTATVAWSYEAGVDQYQLFVVAPDGSTSVSNDAPSGYCAGDACSSTLSAPQDGTYQVQVRARNAFGWSDWTVTEIAVNNTGAPVAPTLATSGTVNTTNTTVEWSPVSNAQGYIVVVYDPLGNSTSYAPDTSVCAETCVLALDGLLNGSYQVLVRARNTAGQSSFASTTFDVVLREDMRAADMDADGIADAFDNCAAIANVDQVDRDGDGIGQACDDNDNPTNMGVGGSDGTPVPDERERGLGN